MWISHTATGLLINFLISKDQFGYPPYIVYAPMSIELVTSEFADRYTTVGHQLVITMFIE